MMAMKLNGRVMKGASSLPIEFKSALETNTLKYDSNVMYRCEQKMAQRFQNGAKHLLQKWRKLPSRGIIFSG